MYWMTMAMGITLTSKQFENTIGTKFRILRRRNDQTQKELADKVGISVSYLSLIERGNRQISFSTFIKLCKGLGVSPVLIAMMLDFDVQTEAEAKNIALKRYGADR